MRDVVDSVDLWSFRSRDRFCNPRRGDPELPRRIGEGQPEARGSFRGPRERPPSAHVPRRMTWCCVPGASSRACRGILALALRLESRGTPSELFLSVNNVPHY